MSAAAPPQPLHCLHVITGLGTGGAEMMLCKLVVTTEGRRLRNTVVSLGEIGPVGEQIAAAGIPVIALGMRAGLPDVRKILRLARVIQAARPDVVQTWMYHANLWGGLASRLTGGWPTVWNIRSSNLESAERVTTRIIARLSGRVARSLSQRIVTNAESARALHVALGYPADLFRVVPNGFDLTRFRPDPQARAAVRQEVGVPPRAALVGIIGRRHPMKDHANFLAAAAQIVRECPDVHFLLAGEGVTLDDAALRSAIGDAGLTARAHLLGLRRDTPRLLASLDLYVSASWYGEAFPNVLGEAMACGVPCVTTDVGDSARIVGNHGRVVAPRDSAALASACLEILRLQEPARRELGVRARQHIEQHYSIQAVAAAYENIYTEIRRAHQQPS